jgi:hypothetical protein
VVQWFGAGRAGSLYLGNAPLPRCNGLLQWCNGPAHSRAVVLCGILPPFNELAGHVLLDAKPCARTGELKCDKRDEAKTARRQHRDVVPWNENRTGAYAKRGGNIQIQPRWCCPPDECRPAVPAGPNIARELEGGALEWARFVEPPESPPA